MIKNSYRSVISEHHHYLFEKSYRVFQDILNNQNTLFYQIPAIRWHLPDTTPELASVFILYFSSKDSNLSSFFEEEISYKPLKTQPLEVVSKNLTQINHLKTDQKLYFLELKVLLESHEAKIALDQYLYSFRKKIQSGLTYRQAKERFLEKKRLSPLNRHHLIFQKIQSYIERFPKSFDVDLIKESEKFCAHLKEDFEKHRHPLYLARIFFTYSLFKEALYHQVSLFPKKRHVYLKGFKTEVIYTFGKKRITSFLIVLNLFHPYEIFNEDHLEASLKQFFPNAEIIKHSLILLREEDPKTVTAYVEVEQNESNYLSKNDIIRLQKQWPLEIKESIESASPSLFVPRNEEESYKNILRLSQELKFVKDLPQSMISFQEQSYSHLKFNVILLRIVKKVVPSIASFFDKSPSNIVIYHEKSTTVGRLRKKYFKQADCFSLEIPLKMFLRKNRSIDLIKAREYVVRYLEKIIGPFRDYNGGFFLKQKEQYDLIKKALPHYLQKYESLLERLLYSLNPQFFIALVSNHTGSKICSLLDELISKEINCSRYVYRIGHEENTMIALIKTDDKKIKRVLESKISSDLLEEAISSLEIDGQLYIAYLKFQIIDKDHFEKNLINLIGENTPKEKPQVLNLHLTHPIDSLDPRIASDRNCGLVLKMLYTGLMRFTSNDSLEYSIAKSYTVSNDEKTYTFHLKKTFWSDGTLLKAADFEYAWKKILEPHYISPYTFLFSNIKNADKAKKNLISLDHVGIRVLDDFTLEVELEFPAPYFPSLTAHWTFSPLCQKLDETHPDWAHHDSSFISNGPFKLKQWAPHSDLILDQNPYYWNAQAVQLNFIKINLVKNEETASSLFKKKKLDWLGDPISKIPVKDIEFYQKTKLLETSNYYGLYWVHLNMDHILFKTSSLRKAFSYAISRKALTEALKSSDSPSTSFYNDKHHFLNPFQDNNLEEAQRLFHKGLEELRIPFDKIPPLVLSHSDFSEHEMIAKILAYQWKKAFNIKVIFDQKPWNRFFKQLGQHGYNCSLVAWHSRYDDPLYYLDLLVNRECGIRVSKWSNPIYDQWIKKAKSSKNPLIKKKWALLAEHLTLQDMPLIPLFFQKWRFVKNKNLKNVSISNIGNVDFSEAYFENKN